LVDWIVSRRPAPPPDLAAALRLEGSGVGLDAALSAAGSARLAEARARPGRVRDSAFRLLEADALITYACEAALETEDPPAALRRVLASAIR
jgi:hypothetical protein